MINLGCNTNIILNYLYCPIGIGLVGGPESTQSDRINSGNIINNYDVITPRNRGLLFRCITGLGPTNNNDELGTVYFNGSVVPNGECNGPVIQARGANMNNFVGVINVFYCRGLTPTAEGVYTCSVRNSQMMIESRQVGVYYAGRSELLQFLMSELKWFSYLKLYTR